MDTSSLVKAVPFLKYMHLALKFPHGTVAFAWLRLHVLFDVLICHITEPCSSFGLHFRTKLSVHTTFCGQMSNSPAIKICCTIILLYLACSL